MQTSSLPHPSRQTCLSAAVPRMMGWLETGSPLPSSLFHLLICMRTELVLGKKGLRLVGLLGWGRTPSKAPHFLFGQRSLTSPPPTPPLRARKKQVLPLLARIIGQHICGFDFSPRPIKFSLPPSSLLLTSSVHQSTPSSFLRATLPPSLEHYVGGLFSWHEPLSFSLSLHPLVSSRSQRLQSSPKDLLALTPMREREGGGDATPSLSPFSTPAAVNAPPSSLS